MAAALESRFLQALQQLPDVRRWVIAHSGGLDSQVLLHLVQATLPGSDLLVVHINHQLQKDAARWALFSEQEAAALGIAHQTVNVQPADGSEKAARDARYAVFAELLREGDCLLLAHHADDQAETLLFRLLRGAGLKGLAAMPCTRALGKGRLLRPLLQESRRTLESYAQHKGLAWVEDPSNADVIFDRNFLRQEVMPRLGERWPGFQRRWADTALQLRAEEELLKRYLDADLAQCVGAWSELIFDAPPMQDKQKRQPLIRRWCERVTGRLLNERQLERIESSVIGAVSDANPELRAGDLIIRRYRNALYLTSDRRSQREGLEAIAVGETALSDGVLSVYPASGGLASLEGLSLVRRLGGERCRPAGRGGSRSVKKCLQEAGIPPWLKQDWPLLMKGDQVVAIPGVCVCEGWQTESTGFNLSWRSFALSGRS